MIIKIKKIKPETCIVLEPNGITTHKLNIWEFNDLRIQITTHEKEGWKVVMYPDGVTPKYYDINKYGTVINYPIDLFKRDWEQLEELLKIGCEKRKKDGEKDREKDREKLAALDLKEIKEKNKNIKTMLKRTWHIKNMFPEISEMAVKEYVEKNWNE